MTAAYATIAFALAVALAWMGVRALKRKLFAAGAEMSSLMLEGEPAKARVLAAERRRMARGEFEYYVTYTFRSRDNEEHRKEFRVSPTELDNYLEGESIDIVYLPRDPSVSATREMVDRVRSARANHSRPAA
ncbi:MAG: DUF3592 domain-containing protein [Woeseiaceae bacterium]|nr:DUF3592 domain-containing protein [Woeseiaceae bacterium]